MTSLRSSARYPSGGTPPIHIPFLFEAAILSRMRSPMTSRSNCAKDSRTLRVKRPIEVVVLNCCVSPVRSPDRIAADKQLVVWAQGETGRRAKRDRECRFDLAFLRDTQHPSQNGVLV